MSLKMDVPISSVILRLSPSSTTTMARPLLSTPKNQWRRSCSGPTMAWKEKPWISSPKLRLDAKTASPVSVVMMVWGESSEGIRSQPPSGLSIASTSRKDGRTLGLLKKPTEGDWEPFTCLNSLRDVEPNVALILRDHGMDREPGQEVEEPVEAVQ